MMDKQAKSRTLGEALRDESLYHRAPQHLRERVRADITRATPRRRPFAWGGLASDGVRAWINGGLAGIAVCALVLSAVALIPRPAPIGPMAEEIVSSHVRALLSQHPIDVISTDQHTVKPWFNGKLDYAPPVVDLAAQGFPLVGGRVDYVDHRVVAVLTYHYLKHPIDLYVFPVRDHTPASKTLTTDGYSIAHWQHNGMSYWAITDAEPVHLHAFEQAALSANE